MKNFHVIMTQDKKIWVFKTPSEVKNFLGTDVAKCKTCVHAGFLNDFLYQYPDFEEYILKGIGYWITCDFYHKEEDIKKYGLLRRKLYEFSDKKNFLRILRNEATSVASEFTRKLRHQKGKKTQYRNIKYL